MTEGQAHDGRSAEDMLESLRKGSILLVEPADIETCTDVFEHLEVAYLDNVLDDLTRLTKMALFDTVALRPAKKHLPDGRNTHLIIKPAAWWMHRIHAEFEVRRFEAFGFHPESAGYTANLWQSWSH